MFLSSRRAETFFLYLCLFVSLFATDQASGERITFAPYKDAKAPLRSPKGVDVVVIYPRTHNPTDIAIDGCHNVTADGVSVFERPSQRPWSGLHALSKKVLDKWKVQNSQAVKTLKYADKRMLKDLELPRSSTSPKNALTTKEIDKVISCVARRMLISSWSLSEAVCSCQSELQGAQYCAAIDYFVLNARCHDVYNKAVDASKVCPPLLDESNGVALSKMCSGWVAGVVSALDMSLLQLTDAAVPDDVDEKSIRQEMRTYYLAWKALHKLGNWADAHLLCESADSKGLLKTTLQDFQLLPEWESIQYIWSHDITDAETPVAVVAKRNRNKFIVAVRDVKTTMEGRAVETNRFAFENLKGFPGKVHLGVANVAVLMLPTLQSKLKEELIAAGEQMSAPVITFIGDGAYGAGIASVLAYLINSRASKITDQDLKLNAVFYEGGAVGDEEFIRNFASIVNVRNVISSRSTLSNLPCSTIYGCSIADAEIPTGVTGERMPIFVKLPGRVTFNADELPGGSWNTSFAGHEVIAHKTCAPACWFFSSTCPDEPDPMCTEKECGAHFSMQG